MQIDRRLFLQQLLGAGAAAALSSCGSPGRPASRGGARRLLPPGQLPPSPRITLKLAGEDFGPPGPFVYFPPAWAGQVTLMFDSLFWSDVTGRLIPWLATGHAVSPDGVTHTYRIRDGVKWQDGRPLTAEDTAFSFNYFLEHKDLIPPWVIFKPNHVTGAKVVGPGAVEVSLDKPAVTFEEYVGARYSIVPKHIWENQSPLAGQDRQHFIGSGPYKLKAYGKHSGGAGEGGFLFEANDDFFLGKPFVRRLEQRIVSDELNALEAGVIDAGGFSADPTNGRVLAKFREDPAFGVLEGPPDFLVALHWNASHSGPAGDLRFRRACAYAIDRKDMVKRLLGGFGFEGNPGFLPPGHPMRVSVQQYDFNPARANQMLEAAGYLRGASGERTTPAGAPLSVGITGPAETKDSFDLVSNYLKRVGIASKFNVIQQEFQIGQDYEMALLLWGGIGQDPDFMRTVYSSRTENRIFFAAAGYKNDEFDDLADKQLVTRDDPQARRDMIARMQQIVAADLPLLHLYYPKPFLIFKKSVFDQWNYKRGGISWGQKQALVTGTGTGGSKIRPIA